ncbi:unnamed protein product [Rotaria socialis]|uniref:SH3 domain-containing protein n=1 Tax=Rotaria socialis TaxID=392032 RepID=A0A818LIK1_9BILA|nr:unnamed protein product [Rotaria socialis]
MNSEKKRYRWRRGPILIEENLVINSTSTTVTTRSEEEKCTATTRRKWYKKNDDALVHDDDDDDDGDDDNNNNNNNIQRSRIFPSETITEKIDRILKKINAWTNETPIPTRTDTSTNNANRTKMSFPKPTKSPCNYDNVPRTATNSNITMPSSNSSYTSYRQRCSSSTYENPPMIRAQRISNPRPFSMAFTGEPFRTNSSYGRNSLYKTPTPPLRTFHRPLNSFVPNRYSDHRRSLYSPNTNLTSLSSLYGSDFFYPPASEQEHHEYDNIPFADDSSTQHCDPFPTIVVDCQRCSQSVDRSLLRDRSCQVPSDEELYQDTQLQDRKTTRSSPLYVSPRSSPPLCHPPKADSLLAPYHFRRKHSLSSFIFMHNRSKSVPSSSSISSQKTDSIPIISPVPIPSDSHANPSTTTLLRSIKTSINAMKRRLKDIRRWSEDSNVTTVLDDYTARSPQELTVSKGQHVRLVQRQPLNTPDWCLIRLLNHHQQQTLSSASSLAVSSITLASASADLSSIPSTKYIEGLVPAAILKSAKSSSSNIQLPPPLPRSLNSSRSEQDVISNNLDELQPRNPSSIFQINKRKSSVRKILKTPVRRLSLKDNSTSKNVKTPDLPNLITNSASIIPADSGNDIYANKREPLSSDSSISRKIKPFTFINTENSASTPNNTVGEDLFLYDD